MAARSGPKRSSIDPERATVAEFIPAGTGETEWDPDLEASFEQLREDFRQANSEGTLWVYRLPLDERNELISNAKHVFLFSAPVQRYSTEEIYAKVQTEFMEGMRVACIRVAATKKGERGVRFNHVVMVEKSQRLATPETAITPAPGGGFSEVVRAIQESNQATVAMVQQLLKQPAALPAPPAEKPIAQIRELAEVVFLLSGGKQAAAAPVAAAAAPQRSILDELKTLRELRGFVTELAGGGGGGDGDDGDDGGGSSGGGGPAAVLKHLSPWANLFAQMMQRQGGARGPVRRPQARQPQTFEQPTPTPVPAPVAAGSAPIDPFSIPTPAPQPATAPQPKTPENDPVIAQLREQFEALTRSAAEGAPPANLAPMILQMIPADSPQEDMFIGFLESPTWWQQLTAVYPPAAPHEQWFTQLRMLILSEYEDDSPAGAAQPLIPV